MFEVLYAVHVASIIYLCIIYLWIDDNLICIDKIVLPKIIVNRTKTVKLVYFKIICNQ